MQNMSLSKRTIETLLLNWEWHPPQGNTKSPVSSQLWDSIHLLSICYAHTVQPLSPIKRKSWVTQLNSKLLPFLKGRPRLVDIICIVNEFTESWCFVSTKWSSRHENQFNKKMTMLIYSVSLFCVDRKKYYEYGSRSIFKNTVNRKGWHVNLIYYSGFGGQLSLNSLSRSRLCSRRNEIFNL